jgi:hypothetical protein
MDKEIKDPLKEALKILDKGIELGYYYNEIYQDKPKDPFLNLALSESNSHNTSYLRERFQRSNSKPNENGLHLVEYTSSIGDSIYPGKYLYTNYGVLHNFNGPAVITNQGAEIYFKYGEVHREDGPAVIFKSLEKDFQVYIHYINNKKHKEDGPAKEVWKDGKLYKSSYYVNNKLHRTDGPAIEWSDGQYIYAIDGKKHKEDGPAVRLKDPNKEGKFKEEYWINGEQISYLAFKIKQMRDKFNSSNEAKNTNQLK